MAREAKPRWHKTRNQWYARIGPPNAAGEAGFVWFPRQSVRTEGEAWDYFRAYQESHRATTINASDPTFGELCVLYRDWMQADDQAARFGPGTIRARKSLLKLAASHVLKGGRELGHLQARQFAVDHLDDLIGWMSRRGYKAHYVKDMARAVGAMVSWASTAVSGRVPRQILTANPIARYSPPVTPDRPTRYVPSAEWRAFFRWAWAKARARETPAGYRRSDADRRFDRVFVLMVRFLWLSGARPFEVASAEWSHVDRKAGTITFKAAEHKTGKKTGRDRTIYLTHPMTRILDAIRRLPARHERWIFCHALAKGGLELGCSAESGQPWTDQSAIGKKLRAWRREAIGAGLKIRDKGPSKLVAYNARHTYITDALLDGATATDVAKMVGNSAQIIEQVYDHPVKERLAERAREIHARRRRSARAEGEKGRAR